MEPQRFREHPAVIPAHSDTPWLNENQKRKGSDLPYLVRGPRTLILEKS